MMTSKHVWEFVFIPGEEEVVLGVNFLYLLHSDFVLFRLWQMAHFPIAHT